MVPTDQPPMILSAIPPLLAKAFAFPKGKIVGAVGMNYVPVIEPRGP